MKRIWIAGCGAAFALAFAGAASAQQDQFKMLDKNGDGQVSMDEWTGSMGQSGAFKRFDTNADTGLDQNEFDTGVNTTYKSDIDAGKFDRTKFGNLAAWDLNKDGKVDEVEYNTGLFKFYDQDQTGGLSDQEFGTSKPLWSTGSSG